MIFHRTLRESRAPAGAKRFIANILLFSPKVFETA